LDTKSFLERLKSEVLITQIKCYDEKGNYFLLPKKSVLLDFAFEKNIKNGTHF
jgi:(p)ppGpp synthase/HD superfamily hydrolase